MDDIHVVAAIVTLALHSPEHERTQKALVVTRADIPTSTHDFLAETLPTSRSVV
jgi:hypothetical protein